MSKNLTVKLRHTHAHIRTYTHTHAHTHTHTHTHIHTQTYARTRTHARSHLDEHGVCRRSTGLPLQVWEVTRWFDVLLGVWRGPKLLFLCPAVH